MYMYDPEKLQIINDYFKKKRENTKGVYRTLFAITLLLILIIGVLFVIFH